MVFNALRAHSSRILLMSRLRCQQRRARSQQKWATRKLLKKIKSIAVYVKFELMLFSIRGYIPRNVRQWTNKLHNEVHLLQTYINMLRDYLLKLDRDVAALRGSAPSATG